MITVNGVEYATTSELAQMMGIHKTRICALRRRLPHFPVPVRQLSNGDLYNYEEALSFARTWVESQKFIKGDAYESRNR